MLKTLVILSILSITISTSLDAYRVKNLLPFRRALTLNNAALEKRLRVLLEKLRQIMPIGNDIIPILEPLNVTSISIDESCLEGMSLLINNLIVNNLSTFSVEALTAKRNGLASMKYRVTYDFEVPLLELETDNYELKYMKEGISVSGKGRAEVNVTNPGISGHIVVRPVFGVGTLHLRLLEVNIKLRLKEFHPNITGVNVGNTDVSKSANEFLKYFVPKALVLFEPQITKVLSDMVLFHGNKFLAEVNVINLLGKFYSP